MYARRFLSFALSAALVCALSLHPTRRGAAARQRPARLVESVDISGNRRLKDVDIFSRVKTRPGEKYSHEQVLEDLRAILALGLFNRRNTRVVIDDGQRGGVAITFEVQELPIIEAVKFEGLTRAEGEALLEDLRRGNLEVGGGTPYEPGKIKKAVALVRGLLLARGWRRVSVEVRVDEVSAASVRITFAVGGLPPSTKKTRRPRRPDTIARLTRPS